MENSNWIFHFRKYIFRDGKYFSVWENIFPCWQKFLLKWKNIFLKWKIHFANMENIFPREKNEFFYVTDAYFPTEKNIFRDRKIFSISENCLENWKIWNAFNHQILTVIVAGCVSLGLLASRGGSSILHTRGFSFLIFFFS